jgi:rhodanese-related sulfurtransferase
MTIPFRPFLTFCAFILFLGGAVSARAEKPVVSPNEIPGTTKVDAEALLKLVETVPKLTIVDSRLRADRRLGHIENSVSLPDVETDCAALGKILAGKNAPVLFYCNGPKCGRSGKAAGKALACGYRNIYWVRGGFEEWQAKGYPAIKE